MRIINARVFTMEEEGIIENGFVDTDGGKILRVGDMSEIPESCDCDIYDAKGMILMPGLIDAHCHIGMWEDSLGFEGDDGNEDTDPVTPQLRAIDAVNPMDRCFADAYNAGVTTVITGPGSANPIAGQSAALKTYGRHIDKNIIKAPVAIKIALGENPKTSYNAKHQTPVTRMATAALIREHLLKAKRYLRDIENAKKDIELEEPELDIKYEALLPALSGDIPVHIHAHRADDIYTAMRIAEEFNLKYVLVHCTEGHLIADDIKEKDTYALCGPSLCDRSKPELRNMTFETPGILDKNGITTAIITDHPVTPIQYLSLCAAYAHKAGMDYMQALKAITINPAKICAIDDRVGSIKAGKDADLVIFNGDPLNPIKADCVFVMVSGTRVKG